MDREELAKRLDELHASLPQLVKDYPDTGEFWTEFAGIADVIEDSASPEDAEFVAERMQHILEVCELMGMYEPN